MRTEQRGTAGTRTRRSAVDADRVLRTVSEGIGGVTGAAFFPTLVQKLAETLCVRYAFVARLDDDHTAVRMLAFWADGRHAQPVRYRLAGTPCEAVLEGERRLYESGVRRLFPGDRWLSDAEAEGFLATPLLDRRGRILGHLAIVHDLPLHWEDADLWVFDIFAARAQAEMERLEAEQALRDSETWLRTVLGGTLDAIVVVDGARRVRMFNAAAERMFGRSAGAVCGHALDAMVSPALAAALDGLIGRAGAEGAPRQAFLPPDLAAVDADGREFPVEATLSALEVRGEQCFVLVLRDVNERRRAAALIARLEKEKEYLREAAQPDCAGGTIAASSRVMHDLLARVRSVAVTDSTVLLLGETGTGKELLAHAIHAASRRSDRILVKVNCAALPEDLMESELFGHEKGAFTGAQARRQGRFELADGGTLFLDEVGELSPAGQARLLRVLQEREFERVGGTETLRVDVRIIAATNRDLGDMVAAGRFRADLYYRLSVFPIAIPPLRERIDDVPLLAGHFLARLSRKLGKPLHTLSERSLDQMMRYPWPGNVRELQNLMERAAILATTPELDLGDLPAPPAPLRAAAEAPRTLRDMERAHIIEALLRARWVVEGPRGAAALLGVSPSTLRYRMQKLRICRPQDASATPPASAREDLPSAD
jgi:PAS domain S-box-containing protein